MTRNGKLCWTLFSSTFKLSAGTFGGGFVIVPLMRERFVRQLHWIEEQEMLDLVAIAESSPGAIAVNASILVGYHAAGPLGALTAVAGTVLPPLLIITAVSYFYSAVRDHPVAAMAMNGLLAGVAAVVCDVVFTMGRSILAQHSFLAVFIMLAAFAAVRFWNVNIVLVILACGMLGAVSTMARRRKERLER